MANEKLNSTPPKIPRARLIVGTVVFIVGFLMPLLVPVVAKMDISLGVKTTISGLLLLGIPELFMLTTIAILGKEGYNFLKQKVFALFKKYGPADRVGKARYRIGLILFSLPLLTGLFLPYFDHLIPDFEAYELKVNIIGDAMLIISLFVLGGDFWDKIRSLFIYNSKAVLITDNEV